MQATHGHVGNPGLTSLLRNREFLTPILGLVIIHQCKRSATHHLCHGGPCVPSAANTCSGCLEQSLGADELNCPHSTSDCSSGKLFEQEKHLPSTVQSAPSLHCISSLLRLSPSFLQTPRGIPSAHQQHLVGVGEQQHLGHHCRWEERVEGWQLRTRSWL